MGRVRCRTGLAALLALVVTLVLAAGGYLVANLATSRGQVGLPSAAAPSALAAATVPAPSLATAAGPPPTAAGVRAALAAALRDPRLGGRVLAEVADAASGRVLLDRAGAVPAPPASTAKLATAVAVLLVHAPTDRITTRVVQGGAPGTVVLVGGGDPTLTAAPAGQSGAYPDAARISALAAQLRGHGGVPTRVVVDDSLFGDPAVSPAWAPEDVPSSYAAPITATMVDGGRDNPTASVRSRHPAAAAGRALAQALGLPAGAVSMGRAPAGAPVLASVSSAPLGTLLAQMLERSDDVIAECLARLVALVRHQPATFRGAAAAIRAVLAAAGVDIGSGLVDGSGLARSDRLTPASLVGLLRLVSGGSDPRLRAVMSALPVAGWDGTLADRYAGSPAAGFVRAKTGTLTGVSTLSGFVQDRDGRLLVFSLVADQVEPTEADTAAAEAALDHVAATLAACGCR